MKKFWIVVAVIVLALMLVFGVPWLIQDTEESAMEDALQEGMGDDAEVEMNDDGTMEVRTDEGTAMLGDELPKDWPEDAPIYAGATIEYSATVNPVSGESGSAVVFSTDAKASDVEAYYQKELVAEGWKMEATMQGGGTTILSATKGARTISLAITEVEGMTSVTMGISEKK